jgi:DNA mismatch repair protein MutS
VPVDQIPATLERIRPAEILYPESWTPNFGLDVARTRQPDWYFDYDSARRLLCDQFEVASLAGFGAEGLKPAIAAAGALLQYAQATQSGKLPHLRGLTVEIEGAYLGLDLATRRNLELTETLRGQPSPTLFSLLDNCVTSMGSRLLRHTLHHPLREREFLPCATAPSKGCSTTTAAWPAKYARPCAASPTSNALPAASRCATPARATWPACANRWPACRNCAPR